MYLNFDATIDDVSGLEVIRLSMSINQLALVMSLDRLLPSLLAQKAQ
jgi:hypothetical protein